MKRIIAAAMVAALAMTGCAKVKKAERAESAYGDESRFVVVEDAADWRVVADRETGAMYAVSYGAYNRGEFTMLVRADGKPLIYEEDEANER